MSYIGDTIPGLTAAQQDLVELALRMAPTELHDGLCRVIATALFATSSPPYRTRDIVAAAATALANYSGIWFPDGLFPSGGSLDGAVGQQMVASTAMSGSGGMQVS
jgi:hypothetical protein